MVRLAGIMAKAKKSKCKVRILTDFHSVQQEDTTICWKLKTKPVNVLYNIENATIFKLNWDTKMFGCKTIIITNIEM